MRGGRLMRKLFCVIIMCTMLIAIFSGCGALKKSRTGDGENDELRPVSSIIMSEDEVRELADKVPVRLYFANEDNGKLHTEIRYLPMDEVKKSVNNLASQIVKELIKGPLDAKQMKATIPKGTKLRSPVSVDGGVATVDLTKDFIENHPGGKEAEQMTIFSIVNALTELKEIQKVKFEIEGKERQELSGSFQFDEPFPRSPSLISKEPPVRSTVSEVEEKEDDERKEDENSDESEETFEDYYLDDFEETFEDFEDYYNYEETYIEILE